MKTNEAVKFESMGFVYGSLWGGGMGAYPARKLFADTKEELLQKANEGLDGSLDSGMGYERLTGAILEVKKITTLNIKGEDYVNTQSETVFIGKLKEKDKDFLFELLMNE